jgi:predicted nucleic acid-binding protein
MPAVTDFLDSNILVYAVADDPKSAVAQDLMSGPFILSTQALNEFANVGRRKLGLSWDRVSSFVEDFSIAASAVVPVEPDMTTTALRLVQHYNLAFYDAVMIAAALKADCATVYSEDMQSGLIIDGKLTIINPFR